MDNKKEILDQVEFYLGDDNLTKDTFFRNLITDSKEGYFDINYILNCNKIQKLEATKQDIIGAIKDSTMVELNKEEDKIRRYNNKELPESLKKQKVVLYFKNEEIEKVAGIEYVKIGLIKFSTDKLVKKNIKQFENIFSKVLDEPVLFVSYLKKQGNILYFHDKVSNEKITQLIEDGIIVKKIDLKFTICDDLEICKNVLRKNETKIEILLKKKFNQKIYKNLPTSTTHNKVNIKFLDKEYKDLKQLKDLFKNIIIKMPNNIKIENQTDNAMLLELVKSHNDKKKFENIDHFIVDINKDYPNTRCFYLINKAGEKLDFSFHKCLNNL